MLIPAYVCKFGPLLLKEVADISKPIALLIFKIEALNKYINTPFLIGQSI